MEFVDISIYPKLAFLKPFPFNCNHSYCPRKFQDFKQLCMVQSLQSFICNQYCNSIQLLKRRFQLEMTLIYHTNATKILHANIDRELLNTS